MPDRAAPSQPWRTVLRVLLAMVLLLALGLAALWQWLQTDHFRQMLAREASVALGVELEFGALGLSLRPLPALRVDALRLKTTPPLTADRIELRPSVPELLAGRATLAFLSVRHAQLPQAGLDDLRRRWGKAGDSEDKTLQKQKPTVTNTKGKRAESIKISEPDPIAALVGSQWELDDIHWLGPAGQALVLDARAQLGPGLLPTRLQATLRRVQLKGLDELRGTVLTLQQGAGSGGDAAQYTVDLKLRAGADPADRGHISGQLSWKSAPAHLDLSGELQTQNLDLLLVGKSTAKGLQPVLSGWLDAKTRLTARAATAGELLQGLQTDSPFTVRQAVLHGMDLAKAVKTVGLSRGGNTPLDLLSGQLRTQGKALTLSGLQARSGALGATGQVAVSPQGALLGQVQVALGVQALPDAARGIVGVPLQVGGTLESPELSLSRAAMIGAAVGSVLMPGAGTAAGASLGDRVGEKFKSFFGK